MGNVSTSRSHSSRRDSDLHRTQASRTDHSRAGSQSTLTQRDRGRTASGGDSGDSRSDQQMAHKRRPSELTSIRSRRSEGCNDEGGHRSTQRSVGSRMEAKGANVPIDVMRTEPQGRRLGLLQQNASTKLLWGRHTFHLGLSFSIQMQWRMWTRVPQSCEIWWMQRSRPRSATKVCT
jgi:hypothetical protein